MAGVPKQREEREAACCGGLAGDGLIPAAPVGFPDR